MLYVEKNGAGVKGGRGAGVVRAPAAQLGQQLLHYLLSGFEEFPVLVVIRMMDFVTQSGDFPFQQLDQRLSFLFIRLKRHHLVPLCRDG